MANTYFQFKQFIVHQEHTAMKVCTDACLFGAWVAADKDVQNGENILDIGTGTGLLSLMLAQVVCTKQTPAKITAVEINDQAAFEAKANFEASPWNDQLTVVNSPIQTLQHVPFNCIISNPPFFEGDLHSPNQAKNLAAHSTALSWEVLINNIDRLLQTNGFYFVLIPVLRAYTMQKLASARGLQLVEEVVVYNAAHQKPFRVMQKFIKSVHSRETIKRSNLIIKDSDNNYSTHFSQLLAPYYLHL